jgi:hypothetical protein
MLLSNGICQHETDEWKHVWWGVAHRTKVYLYPCYDLIIMIRWLPTQEVQIKKKICNLNVKFSFLSSEIQWNLGPSCSLEGGGILKRAMDMGKW